jgi:hypothetical protein
MLGTDISVNDVTYGSLTHSNGTYIAVVEYVR